MNLIVSEIEWTCDYHLLNDSASSVSDLSTTTKKIDTINAHKQETKPLKETNTKLHNETSELNAALEETINGHWMKLLTC